MNKSICTFALLLFVAAFSEAKDAIDPSITPSLFRHTTEITVVYDVTGTGLANLTDAFAWVWIPGSNIDAKYNVNPASSNSALTANVKFIKSVVDGRTLFSLTFTPSSLFASDISGEASMGILLKGNDWSNGQTTDYIADFWDGSFVINLVSPSKTPIFADPGDILSIRAEVPVAADFDLFINGVLVNEQNGAVNFSYDHTITESSGEGSVRLVATGGDASTEKIFQYLISVNSPAVNRPAGIIPGINYNSDPTKVTLCLWAPSAQSVYASGDFSNWEVRNQYLMKKDGEYFWIEISGLAAGEEVAYQYLVNEFLFIADPYSDKILDPDDQYIPESVYPSLMQFPAEALRNEWYFNRVSVFQTGQPAYSWSVTNFERPAKEKLVIYELLIRDFFENGERTYANLTDTLSYFKRLGVNAIELMPIMEFNGNESWGYNPAFMFAPDKYYGPKNRLKEFIDACHANGIAVILDIALNHQDIPNPYLMMDFDFGSFKPTSANKWFNISATHPFSVFYDMNHESPYTKQYVDTINHYWLSEYKVDGFRFDLSKGFTQTSNPTNVEAWSAYDASRIAILKRMADKIWEHFPDAYVILEHLSVNSEEKELAEYRASEGKGMMLWGKMTDPYNQATMGYSENSNISGIYHEARDWSVPRLVGYMESHDEERLMFKNISYGNRLPAYDVRDTTVALMRQRAAATVFYTVPGPKMLWQFGELGYDYSINRCEDGSIDPGCRLSPKPVRWDYREDAGRKLLLEHTAELMKLKTTYDIFSTGSASITADNSLVKKIVLTNDPYSDSPASADDMNAVVVANFDMVEREVSVSFPHGGTWFDFYHGGRELQVSGTNATVTFAPGAYRLYTDYPITPSVITGVPENLPLHEFNIYPNPVLSTFFVAAEGKRIRHVSAYTVQGSRIPLARVSETAWDASGLLPGIYMLEINAAGGSFRTRILKK